MAKVNREQLWRFFARLPEEMPHGTLSELAEAYGVTRERIRQLHAEYVAGAAATRNGETGTTESVDDGRSIPVFAGRTGAILSEMPRFHADWPAEVQVAWLQAFALTIQALAESERWSK